ncbi:MAG: arylesterase [Geminicoccaceae bacterium]
MLQNMVRWSLVLKAALVMAAMTAAAEAAPCRIAVLGDSLTAGYGLGTGEGFPYQLQRRLEQEKVGCEVLDAGVSGDTSSGGLARLDWVLADQPTHLIVELGANDALRAQPPAQLKSNLDAIVTQAQAAGVHVLLAGMLAPPNLGKAYAEEFAAAYDDVADAHDIPLYPFFLEGVAGVRDLNLDDGIHPTAEGIGVIVERMAPAVLDWLKSTGNGPAS